MARIRIDDLPLDEFLTPEEEQLIIGAGLKSFRPSLEALEDRQMMASNLAASLPLIPPALNPAAVSVRTISPDYTLSPNQAYRPASYVPTALMTSSPAPEGIQEMPMHKHHQAPPSQKQLMQGQQLSGSALFEAAGNQLANMIGNRLGTTYGDCKLTGLRVEATANGYKIYVNIERNFIDNNYDTNLHLRTRGQVVITMKYEGNIDGVDRFSMQDFTWTTTTVGVNRWGDVIRRIADTQQYDINIFGVSEAQIRQDYQKVLYLDSSVIQGTGKQFVDAIQAQISQLAKAGTKFEGWEAYATPNGIAVRIKFSITQPDCTYEGNIVFHLKHVRGGGGIDQFDVTVGRAWVDHVTRDLRLSLDWHEAYFNFKPEDIAKEFAHCVHVRPEVANRLGTEVTDAAIKAFQHFDKSWTIKQVSTVSTKDGVRVTILAQRTGEYDYKFEIDLKPDGSLFKITNVHWTSHWTEQKNMSSGDYKPGEGWWDHLDKLMENRFNWSAVHQNVGQQVMGLVDQGAKSWNSGASTSFSGITQVDGSNVKVTFSVTIMQSGYPRRTEITVDLKFDGTRFSLVEVHGDQNLSALKDAIRNSLKDGITLKTNP